jgi:hypothetical protein
MDNDAMIKIEGVDSIQKWSADDFAKVSTTGDYLPRLQLMTAGSEQCKTGEFPINHYAIVKDSKFTDYGPAIDILPIAWRPKALDMSGEVILTDYTPDSEKFKAIITKSEVNDSGCMYGPEYLVWVPVAKTFALFFLGSKSGRRESPKLNARLLTASTLKSKKIVTEKHTWFCPEIARCSTPFDVPTKEQIVEQVEKFNNPPEQVIEEATVPDAPVRDR